MPEINPAEWDEFLKKFPNAHLLQTSAWGELKASFGWEAVHVVNPTGASSGAQVLLRKLPFGYHLAYIPKGLLVSPEGIGKAGWESLLAEIDDMCHKRRVIFLIVEPDLWESAGAPDGAEAYITNNPPEGFQLGRQSIQPQQTVLVDISVGEDHILAGMKQKTRYNVRLAQKKGVSVSSSEDIETFHRLMLATGERDAFGVHSLGYYRKAYQLFHPQGECELFTASVQGQAVAGLMAFARGQRAWYFYGASLDQYRELMPNYLLQWESMRWARGLGCTCYDLWGVPDEDEASLEANFQQESGGLWGVYRFKRGFGGKLFRAAGPWERVYMPGMYRLVRRLRKSGVAG